ncbi:LLM class flavin-dependent oxidoreductase [Janthinobacterium sp. LB2P49]|uniref:LLM class flavin-dependent oxidoreductase n=1 Tax=Janthinobacterium sp. LB2P49 TaxID=3424198 RepID=UPI003F244BDF
MPARQLGLNVFLQRHGHHPAAWRQPSASASGRPDLAWWLRAAKLAEAARFDSFFIADFIGRSGAVTPDTGRAAIGLPFEPFTLLSAIAAVTSHIGLIATINTNYEHPYHVARKFSSLDHLSGGRAGWNVVSSFGEHTARNFGILEPRSHAARYARADEFVALSKALWDSWDDDALDQPDRAGGQFYAPAQGHALNFQGEYFASRGHLGLARPANPHTVAGARAA